MIRPSALNIAQHCGLAPALAERFPESSSAANRGTEIHRQIAVGDPATPEAKAALDWLAGRMTIGREIRCTLTDPESGTVITAGTCDAACIDEDGAAHVIDWKTGRPDNVPPPEENLQLHAYGLALSADRGCSYRVSLAFLAGDTISVRTSAEVTTAQQWEMLARIKGAADQPPVAKPGDHCQGCYQRHVCPSWRERATTALTLLPGRVAGDLTLTPAEALELRRRADMAADVLLRVEDVLRAHVRGGGAIVDDGGKSWGPVQVAGRRSGPTVKELEAQGLGHLIKQGAPGERWCWSKAR